jgi:hypothetical protein
LSIRTTMASATIVSSVSLRVGLSTRSQNSSQQERGKKFSPLSFTHPKDL